MCSVVGFLVAAMMAIFVLQGHVLETIRNQEDKRLDMVTRYGDISVIRAFLEAHKLDLIACTLCSTSMTDEKCNSSESSKRRELCIDILQYCRSVCGLFEAGHFKKNL